MGFCARPPAIATEFCARGSVGELLEKGIKDLGSPSAQELTWTRRLRMAQDAAAGMLHLHTRSQPLVHRDLKSFNLLVATDWTVKVADFGLSKLAEDAASRSKASTMMNINPRWMAPELLQGKPATPASDVYAFGLVLWELMTWKTPWHEVPPFTVGSLSHNRCITWKS